MHSNDIHASLDSALEQLEKGEMNPTKAKAIEGIAREKRSLWALAIRFAEHRNMVASIPELESQLPRRKAA